jgi:hypothetical protein
VDLSGDYDEPSGDFWYRRVTMDCCTFIWNFVHCSIQAAIKLSYFLVFEVLPVNLTGDLSQAFNNSCSCAIFACEFLWGG